MPKEYNNNYAIENQIVKFIDKSSDYVIIVYPENIAYIMGIIIKELCLCLIVYYIFKTYILCNIDVTD